MCDELNHTPVTDRNTLRGSGGAACEIHIKRCCIRHGTSNARKHGRKRSFLPGRNLFCPLQEILQKDSSPPEGKLLCLFRILFVRNQNRRLQHVKHLLRSCCRLPHINKAVEAPRIDSAEHCGHRIHGLFEIERHRALCLNIRRQELSCCPCLPYQLPERDVLLGISERRPVRKVLCRLLQKLQNVMYVFVLHRLIHHFLHTIRLSLIRFIMQAESAAVIIPVCIEVCIASARNL